MAELFCSERKECSKKNSLKVAKIIYIKLYYNC